MPVAHQVVDLYVDLHHITGRPLVVNDVPADVCETCVEAYVEDDAARVLAIATEACEAQAQVLVRDFAPAAGRHR